MRKSYLTFICTAIAMMVFPFFVIAQEKSFNTAVLSGQGKEAYQSLLKETIFAIGGTGYGGETSKGEVSLDVLITETEAIAAFKSLIRKGSPEGGLYALLGLKILGCDCYKQEIELFKKKPEPPERKDGFLKFKAGYVGRMSGCTIFAEPWLTVVDYLDNDGEPMIANKIRKLSKTEKQN